MWVVGKIFFCILSVEIEWVEESLPKSYEDELVEDLISIMYSFSAKIYGRRSAIDIQKKIRVLE